MPIRLTPRKTAGLITATIVLLLCGGFRVALPSIVHREVNRQLAALPEYEGRIDGIKISLWRGAYVIEGLELTKRDAAVPVPFVMIDQIDFSVQWKALFKGQIVAQIEAYHPQVNFVNGPTAAQQQSGAGVDWRTQVEALVPLEISRVAIYDGEVHYADFSTQPKVDVFVDLLQVEVTNLTNHENRTGNMVATVEATCRPMQLGSLTVHATVDPYADQPTFDLDVELEGVELTQLNSFAGGYAKFEFEGGTLGAVAEVASHDGKLDGYVKPVLTGVRVLDLRSEIERDRDGPFRIIWEALLGGANGLLTNDETGRLAMKVEFSGGTDSPTVATWPAVLSVLKNAFIEAMYRGLDNDISLPADLGSTRGDTTRR